MQVDIRVPVGRPIPEVVDVIARCEDAGFDGVGVHDHPHSGRDAYLVLALAAERTRRIRLYPATSSPIVRHPVLLASLAHSLDELAPGRICLTVAPGFLSARSVGRRRATVDTMREAVVALRRLLAGESVAFGDPPSRLRNLGPTPPPVYLLAAGPRMVELAGEVADGAFLMVGLHRDAVAAARAPSRGGRPPGGALARWLPHRVHRDPRHRGEPCGGAALAPGVVRSRASVADLSERVEPLLASPGRSCRSRTP